jgi:hypothetical protein
MTEYSSRPASASNLAFQHIGRIAGPVAGVVVLITLIAVTIVILKGKRKGKPLRTELAEVFPYPNTTSASNGVTGGKRQPVGVDHKLDAARALLEAEVSTREETSSSTGNDNLSHREDREQDAEISPPVRERRVFLSR